MRKRVVLADLPGKLDDFPASRPQNCAVVRRILTTLFLIFASTGSNAHFKAFEKTCAVSAGARSKSRAAGSFRAGEGNAGMERGYVFEKMNGIRED